MKKFIKNIKDMVFDLNLDQKSFVLTGSHLLGYDKLLNYWVIRDYSRNGTDYVIDSNSCEELFETFEEAKNEFIRLCFRDISEMVE